MREIGVGKHKVLQIHKAHGKFIHAAYNASQWWLKHQVSKLMPGDDKLLSARLPLGKTGDSLVVLDDYGDEIISTDLRKQLGVHKQTIGILCASGEIVQVGFIQEQSAEGPLYAVVYWSFGDITPSPKLLLPPVWLARIDELMSAKRPFHLTLSEHVVFQFVDRWMSLSDLQDDLHVVFHFKDTSVQVWGESYREMSRWQDVPRPKIKKRKVKA